jgi:hypothetical protein
LRDQVTITHLTLYRSDNVTTVTSARTEKLQAI